LWLKNGAVNTKAPSTVLGHGGSANVLTVLVATKMKMNNWTNCHSWGLNAPRTAQVIVLATSGVLEKATFRARVLTVPVSTKALTCGPPENKLTAPISKYITA
jgi:hypothetical protein